MSMRRSRPRRRCSTRFSVGAGDRTIRFDVVQIQQWLTDAVAVGTEDALRNGEAEAQSYATDLKAQVEAAIPLATGLGLDGVVASLREMLPAAPAITNRDSTWRVPTSAVTGP
ncbi:MAG: hypothetical protein HC834_11145, partial [Rhodospirillales bacterium]|nr:hypothetical protein [Rhodospirillales bacterium]